MSVNVVFVVPFAMSTTLRFVQGVADQPGVSLGLVTMQPADRLPRGLRESLAGHWQVESCFDPQQLADGVRGLARSMGGRVDRLLAALEELQVPVAEVREALEIPGATEIVARNFREKSQMKTVFERAGVPCARHRQIASVEPGLAFGREIGYPLVVKPPAGAGSKATFRVENEPQLREALAVHRPRPGNETLIEEFVQGSEYSLENVTIGGQPVWHGVSRYYPTPLTVVETPWIQWCVMVPREADDPQFDDIRAVARHALSALGMHTGLTHMEWFRRRDGSLAVSEVAMRPPGSHIATLHSYANDFDLYKAWGRLMVHHEFDVPERRYSSGAAFFRGQGPSHGRGRVKALLGLDKAQLEMEKLGVEVMEHRLPRPGQPKASTYEGEGFAIVRHRDTQKVQEALRRLVSIVRVEME